MMKSLVQLYRKYPKPYKCRRNRSGTKHYTSRKRRSYKRRVLNDMDTYLLDLKVTHSASDKSLDITKYIHEETINRLTGITPYFTVL